MHIRDLLELGVRSAGVGARRLAADFAQLTGILRSPKGPLNGCGVIFTGHRVGNASRDTFAPNAHLAIAPAFLDALLTHLSERAIPVVTMREALDRLAAGRGPFACFTFDDGYLDNLDVALPIFQRHRAPFTVFVAPGLVDQTVTAWWLVLEHVIARQTRLAFTLDGRPVEWRTGLVAEKRCAFSRVGEMLRTMESAKREAILGELGPQFGAAEAARRAFLDWDGLRRLHASGLVEIGCHTVSHAALSSLDPEKVLWELAESREIISARLGIPVDVLAYPYGDPSSCGSREYDLAGRLGYAAAFTTEDRPVLPGDWDRRHALPRVTLNGLIQKLIYVDWQMGNRLYAVKTWVRRCLPGIPRATASTKPLVFIWDNFGPAHADRCEAVAAQFAGRRPVIGIELAGQSSTYAWQSASGSAFQKWTLFEKGTLEQVPFFTRLRETWAAARRSKGQHFFLCHYEHLATLVLAILLRISGRKVFVMQDSKFDDYQRFLPRELLKWIFYLPYQGAITGSPATANYLTFLGFSRERLAGGYDSMAPERLQTLAKTPPAPDGVPFDERDFIAVARFVPKKNLSVALAAYGLYRKTHPRTPRALHLCGAGPLEGTLRTQAADLGLGDSVHFHGFLQADGIAHRLAHSLALLLPSTEEQFGNVVIEALALGIPVIVSDRCGARHELVRAGVNGFVVESDNPEGFAYFMGLLSENEPLWRRLSLATRRFLPLGHAKRFADSVEVLVRT